MPGEGSRPCSIETCSHLQMLTQQIHMQIHVYTHTLGSCFSPCIACVRHVHLLTRLPVAWTLKDYGKQPTRSRQFCTC